MAHLLFRLGEEPLIEYRLRPGRTTIGRADSCDVALPGGEISRTHCIVDGDGESWRIIDRSRHGITVDGKPATRAELRDGSVLSVGPYTVEVRLSRATARPTDDVVGDRAHELILATDDGTLMVEQSWLVVVAGPDQGRRVALRAPRLTVGGPGSDVALRDPDLQPDHARLRTSRGRVMVEPGRGATFLDGARVRDVTPLYLEDELSLGQTVLRVERAPQDEQPVAGRFGDMVGESAPLRAVFGTLRRYAGHHFPVLITGESGTGKELAARGVHDASSRAGGPYVPINCAAIAANLFESELFGHERGAFTGADARKDGAFHKAEGGTLFLDEVGELPLEVQSKLLRALESGEVRRVGSTQVSYPDVRVVAATNRDLVAEVRRGEFREDLYFRLAVLSVHVPPLRERPQDVAILARSLARGLHPGCEVTDDAVALLQQHAWPGNVRELRNVLTRAYVMTGPRIDAASLSFHDLGAPPKDPGADAHTLEEAERAYIMRILDQVEGNRSAAARILGLPRSSLQYKIRRLGIE
ncbi:sigma 54-interacting transcriptional regulator [Myxococcota bacterium]|nr:sigma 54-interacting transcriptional regulator [Myxococcota bacterium]